MAKKGGGKKGEWRADVRGVRAKLEPEHEDHTRRMRKRDLNESQLSHDSEFQRNPQGHSTFFHLPLLGARNATHFRDTFGTSAAIKCTRTNQILREKHLDSFPLGGNRYATYGYFTHMRND